MKAVHIKCNVVQIFNFHGTRHIIKSVRRLVLCIWRRLSAQRFITKIYIRFLTFRLKRQSTANVFVQLRIIEAEGPTIMGFFSRNQNLENISHMKCCKIFRIQDIYFAIGLLYTQLKHLHAAFSAYLLFRNTERLLFFHTPNQWKYTQMYLKKTYSHCFVFCHGYVLVEFTCILQGYFTESKATSSCSFATVLSN